MPFALVIIGVVLLIAAVRGTTGDSGSQKGLFTLVKGDFSGPNNFIYWFVAILIIGMIGYIPDLKKLSVAFLTLVIVVLFLSRGGFFQQFTSALGSTQTGAVSSAVNSATSGLPNLSTLLTLPSLGG